jgi:hypothetical protein
VVIGAATFLPFAGIGYVATRARSAMLYNRSVTNSSELTFTRDFEVEIAARNLFFAETDATEAETTIPGL